MISIEYIWCVWSLILLGIWVCVYALLRSAAQRRAMLLVSAWTSIFGLTEPFFVPEYWSPPSLFGLALKIGFDIESILFTFALAGIAASIYWVIFPTQLTVMPAGERHNRRHRIHRIALISGPATFFALAFLSPLNPIYALYIAALVGGALTLYCRPDLGTKMSTSGILFALLYFVYFWSLLLMAPGYVERVWNLAALSGVLVVGVPLEELL